MNTSLDKLWNRMARDTSLTLQIRLYRLMCLTTGILCLAVALPANAFQHLPILANISVLLLGIFALYSYRESCRGRNHVLLFLFVLVLSLDSVWFLNAGSQGSITYYFFPALLYPMTLLRGKARWVATALLMLNVYALLTLEYFFPVLTVEFQAPSDRRIDLLTGAFCNFFAMALIVWVVVANYDWEREVISRVARELVDSEQNYREVVENAKSIILRLDRRGQVTFFNKFAEELFGYQRAEILGKSALGTIVPKISLKGEDLGAWISQLLQHPEQHAQTESENICHDGRRIRVNWTHQPIYDDHGQLLEILCVGADVTEHAALVERLQLTQKTMDSAAEEIIWTNDRACIIYANTAAAEMLGYNAEELCRMTIDDISEGFTASVWEDHWKTLKRDRFIAFESVQRRKDGSTFPVEITASYLNLGGTEYAMAFIRNITERKNTEEKRLLLEQQMLHLQKLESLGVLAGGIAHDFNNLLTVILGNLSLLKLGMRTETDEYELLREAEKASNQARDLTTQLLTFSKGGNPIKTAIALAPVIRDSASLALRGSSVKCVIQAPDDLWAVEADAAQLTQVFNNLLINAHQAMPGGGQIAIEARNVLLGPAEGLLLPEGRYAQVTVQDQGAGIAEKDIPRIFDPYFTTKKTGSGIGLSVVFSIIKNHCGQISVQSKLGAGTTFTLLLPASDGITADAAADETVTSAQACRILIMDDEEMVRNLLGKMLRKLGCEVECARDGGEALNLYQQAAVQAKPFDAVIMDLTVPGGMGGKEAIQKLREIDPKVKALVSSGYSDDPVMANYGAHGFRGIVSKPYSISQIKTVLREVLEKA